MQPSLQDWLNRKPAGRKPKKRLPRVKPERAKQYRKYNNRVPVFLSQHPICEVWCKENGWRWVSPSMYEKVGAAIPFPHTMAYLIMTYGAPPSDQVHHTNKRRGEMLLDERYWLAVSDKNHKRIEDHKDWARANGFLLNF